MSGQGSENGQGGQQGGQQGANGGHTPDEINVANILLTMATGQPGTGGPGPGPPPAPNPTHAHILPANPLPPPPPTLPSPPVTNADVQAAMDGPLQDFVEYAMRTRITPFPPRYYRRVAQVANRFGGHPRIRDALAALDYADWDVGAAIQQLRQDAELQRAATNAGPAPAGRDPHRNLDRARASGGPNWKKTKLYLQIQVEGKWKFRDYQDVDENFNVENPSPRDLLRLNEWRHRIILDWAGPLRPPRGMQQGEWWHPATIRHLRRRIKENHEKDALGGNPGYAAIAKAHNELFDGMKLPGDAKEVPKRGYQQVASAISRKWKDKEHQKKGVPKQVKEALKVIEEEEAEEKQQTEATYQADFTATEEDFDEVEKEVFVYETDTDSDEE